MKVNSNFLTWPYHKISVRVILLCVSGTVFKYMIQTCTPNMHISETDRGCIWTKRTQPVHSSLWRCGRHKTDREREVWTSVTQRQAIPPQEVWLSIPSSAWLASGSYPQEPFWTCLIQELCIFIIWRRFRPRFFSPASLVNKSFW